jgi:translocation and assembly module TamB
MRKRLRLALSVAAILTAIAIMLSVAGVFLLRSHWFSDFVRRRTVAAIERATGGAVELQSFDFHWSTLTAEFKNLVVHGTEPANGPPMFQAPSIRIVFPTTALLRRQIIISSLQVDHPQIYFLMRPEGSTNLPQVQNDLIDVEDMLSLHVGHFDFNTGTLRADMQSIPIDARGSSLSLRLRFARSPDRYDIHFSSHELHFDSPRLNAFDGSLDLRAQLRRDRIVIQNATLRTTASILQAKGVVQHFADPRLDFDTSLHLAATDLANFADLPKLQAGTVDVSGTFHYDSSKSATFLGRLAGEHLSYRFPMLTLADVAFTSEATATRAGVLLNNVHLKTPEGTLTGAAQLVRWQMFSLNGAVRGAQVDRIFELVTRKNQLWSGFADGSLRLSSSLDRHRHDFEAETRLHVVPGTGAKPVAGDISASYRRNGNVLQLDTKLTSAQTELALSGTVGGSVKVHVRTTAVAELQSLIEACGHPLPDLTKIDLTNSEVRYDGQIVGELASPDVSGDLLLRRFGAAGERWDEAKAHFSASASGISVSPASLTQQRLNATVTGSAELSNWSFDASKKLKLNATVSRVDIRNSAARYANLTLPLLNGLLSGSARLTGSLDNPGGSGNFTIESADAFGQTLNEVQATFTLDGDKAHFTKGKIQAAAAAIAFKGTYEHQHRDWTRGQLQLHLDSNGFPLNSLSPIARLAPTLNGRVEIHADTAFKIAGREIAPDATDGEITLRDVAFQGIRYGDFGMKTSTAGNTVNGSLAGTLQGSALSGSFAIQLTPGNPTHAELSSEHLDLQILAGLAHLNFVPAGSGGWLKGRIQLDGALAEPAKLRGQAQLQDVEMSPPQEGPQFVFRNDEPVVIDFAGGLAHIRNLHFATREGRLSIRGQVGYLDRHSLDLDVNGQVALRAFEMLDSNVTAAGSGTVEAALHGTVERPTVDGTLAIHDGSFYLKGVANGLTNVNGSIRFNRDRASIERLTAQSGGGHVELLGFISFAAGGPLVYNVKATADGVRLRYAGALSVTASAALQLTGATDNGLISGTVSISRVVLSPETDVGGILALTAAPSAQPVDPKDLFAGLQLDIRIESAPSLQVIAAQSRDIEADLDLHLRGTPARPLLFGSISADQGVIRIFGAKYSINRGEVTFANPVRIEPVLDLDIETIARGITVDITVSGTLNKLNMNYRSDPPLQPRDIIALLTVGQQPGFTPNLPNAQPAANDVSALQAGANTVLGQAIAPASGRLSKLFGITNIKIDPLIQGITNTPQSRLTVEQQISQNVTVTYVTNLAQTSEQIFRFEWALNPQYSVVAIRDDNGEFGIDFQYKKRFK